MKGHIGTILDVKSAFFFGKKERTVCIEPPSHGAQTEHGGFVGKLEKSDERNTGRTADMADGGAEQDGRCWDSQLAYCNVQCVFIGNVNCWKRGGLGFVPRGVNSVLRHLSDVLRA